MKRLMICLKDYKKECILAPLFKMLEASFELMVPLVMAAIIDVGIGNGDRPYIVKMCFLLIILGTVGLVSSVTAQYYAAKAAVSFGTGVRHALFEHLQRLSFTEIDTLGTSTMITRMTSDINQVQNGVNMVLRLFLRSPFIVFGAMIMAFTIDTKAALIFVVTIPLLSIVVFGIMFVTMPLYKKIQGKLDQVLLHTRENLTGVRVVRAFAKEEDEIESFHEESSLLYHLQKYVGKISALTNPVTLIIVNGATMILLYTGAVRVDSGNITQGQVVALVNYMSQILVELVKLANLIITLTKSMACASRIESALAIESTMQSGNIDMTHVSDANDIKVEFRNVSMVYAGSSEESLTDINFAVRSGETVGIIGGTGSGKTSLVHMIPRFYDSTKGEVLIDGVDVRKYPLEELRNKVGIVMQKPILFKGTIRENMQWANETATDEEIYEAMDIAQAREFVEQKDGKLSAHVNQGGKNLSGGQKQRLTIARAVVKKPEILILDDSASALDFATDAKLRMSIRKLKNTTTFIVSQRTSSLQHADKIIVLDDGTIAGMGTHEELLTGCEIYQEIYYSQFPKESQAGGSRA